MTNNKAKMTSEHAFTRRQRPAEIPRQSVSLPWSAMSRDETARFGFSMRLNEYWLEVLRDLAAEDDRSMQYVARNILLKALAHHAEKRETQALARRIDNQPGQEEA